MNERAGWRFIIYAVGLGALLTAGARFVVLGIALVLERVRGGGL